MAKKESQGPAFVRFFGPVLQSLSELGGSAQRAEVCDRVFEILKTSEAQQAEVTATGAPRYAHYVTWARFYLAKGGFIESSGRGVWTLTEKGRRAAAGMSHGEALKVFNEVHSQFPRRALELEGPRFSLGGELR